jgi:hypothetical protein
MSRPQSKEVNMLREDVRRFHVRLRDLAAEFTGLVRQRHALALKRHRMAEAGEAVEGVAIGEIGALAEIAEHLELLRSKAEG